MHEIQTPILRLLSLFFPALGQFPMEEIQEEIDSLKSLETPFEIRVKLKSDIESESLSDGMDLTLDFDVISVSSKMYTGKEIQIFMNDDRQGLLRENFKNGGTYTLKIIKNFDLMESPSGSNNMIVGFTGVYERVVD